MIGWKQKLLKLIAGIASLVIAGEGYLIIERIEAARVTAERGVEAIELASVGLSKVAALQTKLTNEITKLQTKADKAKLICSNADKSIVGVGTEVAELNRKISKLTEQIKKLRKW